MYIMFGTYILSYREDPLEVEGTKLYIRLANIVLLGQIYNPAYKRGPPLQT